MEKQCKVCNVVKPISQFPATYNTCTECRNNKRREDRKNKTKKTILDLPHLPTFQRVISNFDGETITIDDVIVSMKQLLKEAYDIKEKSRCLSFPYELQPIVHTFLEFCMEKKKLKISDVRKIVYDRSSDEDFYRDYGVSRDVMVSYMQKIGELEDTMNSIKEMYNEMIDAANHQIPKQPTIPRHDISYNFVTKCIEIPGNPLDLDQVKFLTRVKSYENHISFKGVIQIGQYEQFYQMYNIV